MNWANLLSSVIRNLKGALCFYKFFPCFLILLISLAEIASVVVVSLFGLFHDFFVVIESKTEYFSEKCLFLSFVKSQAA